MTTVSPDSDLPAASRRKPRGAAFDPVFRWTCGIAATMLLASLGWVLVSLAIGGSMAFKKFGFGFLTSVTWNPVTEVYGGAGPIVGTLITSALSLAMALPLALGIAVFLVEFCPKLIARPIAIAVELLAGIPSIVYGMWGLFVFAPFFAKYVQLPLAMSVPPDSLLDKLTQGVPNGANIFTASVILAIMILPFMAAVFRELFLTVPAQLRESSFALGSTPLETVSKVIMPYVGRGIIGATMLGLGRALGETMAVTFIIGNTHAFPKSLFDAGSTIASTIANEFEESTSDMHTSALILLGLVLFVITFSILAIARALLSSQRYQ
jgi:phosphate transport system permease protein